MAGVFVSIVCSISKPKDMIVELRSKLSLFSLRDKPHANIFSMVGEDHPDNKVKTRGNNKVQRYELL